jgi:hypothetical protein
VRRLPLLVVLLAVLVAAAPAGARGAVRLQCANAKATAYVLVARPRACLHFGPGGAFGGGVNLARLRWSGWDRARATATGIEKGFHLPESAIRVRVTVFRVRPCAAGRVYTRLRATSRFGTTTVRLGCARGPA